MKYNITNRIIPILLLDNGRLVKTIQFSRKTYIGDPINAIKIFNEKGVDELIILDINATKTNTIDFDLIEECASECFMPLAYGGGIRNINDAMKILKLGVEKIAINTYNYEDPNFLRVLSEKIGNQSIIASIDIKQNYWGKYEMFSRNGKNKIYQNLNEYIVKAEELGAGELLINSIDRDGTMKGYDIKLLCSITKSVNIPVIAAGGAGNITDFRSAIHQAGVSAVAAGSIFVYYGPNKAVLINYPNEDQISNIYLKQEKEDAGI